METSEVMVMVMVVVVVVEEKEEEEGVTAETFVGFNLGLVKIHLIKSET